MDNYKDSPNPCWEPKVCVMMSWMGVTLFRLSFCISTSEMTIEVKTTTNFESKYGLINYSNQSFRNIIMK